MPAIYGKVSVVFLNLGKAATDDYETACILIGELIRDEAFRMQWLMDSWKLIKFDKLPLERMLLGDFSQQRDLYNSLRVLMELLHKHYEKQVIFLIDEYDTPLKRAKKKQYYEQMTSLIRTVFGRAFKANNSLLLACLAGRRRKPGAAISAA